MTQEQWERKKLEIETLLSELEQDHRNYAAWYRRWRERQQQFRCKRAG